MAFDTKGLDDYIDVAQRIADFRERYPEGTLQPANPAQPWEQAVVNGIDKTGKPFAATMIVYTAAAYRHPDDQRPGIGVAWEPFPGRTSFTLGSELMNAETSAWGRAIIAVGASDSKRGIASREEVRNRRAERDDGLPTNKDGSLSRSQTSDEEKDAAGVMTKAQNTEHSQLVKGADGALPPHEAKKVEHGINATPDDDPFYLVPEEIEHQPKTASDEQVREINTRLVALGVKDRDKKLAWLATKIGRDIGSSKDLSMTEASRLLRPRSGLPPAKAKVAAP